MNKELKRGIVLGIVFLLMVTLAAPCYAQNPAKKLGRGLANILTGWVELPKNIYDTSVEDNPFAGITIGTAKGVGMTIVRTGAGIYEAVTFPFPLPEEYKPILEPEFVFSEE
ncbi:MAG: exosortase system-associated protein, TIGR04073 family [Candidatus Omnitrophica bacterium]|nr:exosortase system-associated protein, TIGR04073 family [Candidatus Omnitrophota bacterium]